MTTGTSPTYKSLILLLLAPGLAACYVEPDILAATSQRFGDAVLVEVTISSRDARSIKRRQLYANIAVTECGGGEVYYAIDPSIGGERVAEFRFATDGKVVKLSGFMPARVLEAYKRPCASLAGGGYFTGKLETQPVPIQQKAGVQSLAH